MPDIPWMLEPRHVVPRDVWSSGERTRGEGVEVGRPELGARAAATRAGGAPAAGDRGGPCRGSRRGRGRAARGHGGHVRDRRASASSERRPAFFLTAVRAGRARRAWPSARQAEDMAVARRAACSRRTRAPHTPPQLRRRCTTRLRRRASARGRDREAALPRRRPALRSRRPRVARGRAPSSACGDRAARAWQRRVRARPRPTRSRRTPDRPAASAPRRESRRDGDAEAPTKRAQTASSSGRSTWQETTAYRSRDVAPIVLEAR